MQAARIGAGAIVLAAALTGVFVLLAAHIQAEAASKSGARARGGESVPPPVPERPPSVRELDRSVALVVQQALRSEPDDPRGTHRLGARQAEELGIVRNSWSGGRLVGSFCVSAPEDLVERLSKRVARLNVLSSDQEACLMPAVMALVRQRLE